MIDNKAIEPFEDIPLDILNKLNKDQFNLEDLLKNDDYINNLIIYQNSIFKTILTSKNIKRLIAFCLKPDKDMNKDPSAKIRYSYYSCQILCSENVLIFNKSIKYIKQSNCLKKKLIDSSLNKKDEKTIINYNGTEDCTNYKKEKKADLITSESKAPTKTDFLNKKLYNSINKNKNCPNSAFFCYFNEFSHSMVETKNGKEEEQLIDLYKIQTIYRELKTNPINMEPIIEYNEEEMKIINDILDEIFDIFNFEYYDEEQIYMEYFQKIVNFLLYNEFNIIINYLFKDPPYNITKFYDHLNKPVMQNLLENILNIISDFKEDKYHKNYIYTKIIQDLFQKLIDDFKKSNFENVEYICELIINTIIKNSEKQLIELFLKNNKILNNLKSLLIDIVNIKNSYNKENIENFEKILINILQILYQLNITINDSFNESSFYQSNKKDINIYINKYNKINIFQYQYLCKNIISNKNIFEAFKNNYYSYLSTINDIYII